MIDILMDQYESALQSLGDLLPEETVKLLQKLSSKRTRFTNERRKRAKAAGMEIEEHLKLVRPSDATIQKAQSNATAKKVASKHAETSDALRGQVEDRRKKARARVQKRLKKRDSIAASPSATPNRALSLSPLPDSVRRHPSLNTKIKPGSKDV